MSTLLIKQASFIVSADENHTLYRDADLLIEDGVITAIGAALESPGETIDARGKIVYPGLVNTHHHLYQTFTRNIPAVQNMELFAWLRHLYAIWRHVDEEVVYYAALVGLADLVRHGATTVFDHHYVFNRNSDRFMDALFAAATAVGVRFHASRGSMSRSQKDGGLPPDSVVQTTDRILADSEEQVKKFHDPSAYSYRQVVLAPCSPFSVSADLMRESARLARRLGVRLHTHLAETNDESDYVMEKEGMRPLAYMETLEWTGDDVWYAHGIHLNDEELQVLSKTKTGVAHCPVSNMKLASGVCRVKAMLDLDIPLGLAVDGSASNDGSNLLAEIRQAYLLHRLHDSERAPSASDILDIATRGGARLLGRQDIGQLSVGYAGDCFLIDTNSLDFVGTDLDPAAIPGAVGISDAAAYTIVGGKVIAKAGQLLAFDEPREAEKARDVWQRYMRRAGVIA